MPHHHYRCVNPLVVRCGLLDLKPHGLLLTLTLVVIPITARGRIYGRLNTPVGNGNPPNCPVYVPC
uniref:Uncharacterized protein n=1 Tax=Salix viminalis TaxID=40686 RepID=A0A6N2L245_SALVM